MEHFFDKTNEFFARMPDRVIRFRWLLLAVLVGLSVFMLFGAVTRTSVNTAANSFLAQDDPAIVALNKFRDQFGSDDSVVLVYRAKDGDVFSKQSLAAVQALTNDLENWRTLPADKLAGIAGQAVKIDDLKHIRRVQSLSNIRIQSATGDTLNSSRLTPRQLPANPEELQKIKALALSKKDYQLAFYSPDGKYAAILVQTDFGSIPSKDYAPKIADQDVALDASFGDINESETALKFDSQAEVQEVTYEKVDNLLYSSFIKALKAVYAPYEKDLEFYPVGLPPLMEFVQQVLQQSASLNLGMILINMVLLWVLFRSFSAVLWPILTIVLSVVWIIGATAWAGESLSSMTALCVMLVFVCGMADCIHVISVYLGERREGAWHRQALSTAYAETGLPMMITCVTNTTGMLALMTSDFYPIRVFAGMSSLGVFMAFLFTVLLLPILLDFWNPAPRPKPQKSWKQRLSAQWAGLPAKTRLVIFAAYLALLLLGLGWSAGGFIAIISILAYIISNWQVQILAAIPGIAAKRHLAILGFFAVLVMACGYGQSRIRVDSNIMELTREGSAIRVAYATADQHMAGTQNMEIMLDTKTTDGILDPKILTRMDALQTKLKAKYAQQVSRTYSLANIVKDTHKIMHEDQDAYYRIPDSQTMVAQLLYLFNSVNPSDRRSLVSDDYSKSHISINVYSAGSSQYQAFFTEVNQDIAALFGDLKQDYPNLEVTLTGTVPLAMRTQDIIAHSQYDSFLMALAVISVIIFLALGSIQAGLLSLIPNVIPALFTYGLMGLLDISLDTDTLLLAPVIIGLAVDDTIHFMSHYRISLIKTKDMASSLKSTITEVGPSVLFTGMILGLGFSIQGFSNYLGTAKMGMFGGIAIFVGILCELFLLPALLILFKPKFGLKDVKTTINY
jgi:predicted RND superfamily exporter protein